MKPYAIAAGCVFMLALLAWPFLFGPSDRELIREALDEAVVASREGKSGGVMAYLSRSLVYNGQPVDDRSSVAQYIRQSHPDVFLEDPTPQIDGDTAKVVTPVTVKMSVGPLPVQMRIDRVEITLAKETGTRWLVIPAPRWRIREVKADAIDVSEWMN